MVSLSIVVKVSEGVNVVDCKWLSKILKAFLICHAAVLTSEVVPSKSLSSLGLPIGAMPIYTIPVNIERVVLTYPVFVAALAGAILTTALSSEPTSVSGKLSAAVKAG